MDSDKLRPAMIPEIAHRERCIQIVAERGASGLMDECLFLSLVADLALQSATDATAAANLATCLEKWVERRMKPKMKGLE